MAKPVQELHHLDELVPTPDLPPVLLNDTLWFPLMDRSGRFAVRLRVGRQTMTVEAMLTTMAVETRHSLTDRPGFACMWIDLLKGVPHRLDLPDLLALAQKTPDEAARRARDGLVEALKPVAPGTERGAIEELQALLEAVAALTDKPVAMQLRSWPVGDRNPNRNHHTQPILLHAFDWFRPYGSTPEVHPPRFHRHPRHLAAPRPEPGRFSGHDRMRAIDAVRGFYQRAAADLGLPTREVEHALARLGIGV